MMSRSSQADTAKDHKRGRKMKKILAVLLITALLLSFAGCFSITGDVTTTPQTTDNAATSEAQSMTDAITTEATTEAPTEAAVVGGPSHIVEGAIIKAFSTKGYEIAEKDGITYVDGVLVVNKTYSIPASYNPGNLTPECTTAFYRMVDAAAAEGINLYVLSGFRSYETQAGLYNRYSEADGQDAADRYSARPGHSEHQTGLAIDVNSVLNSFKDTPEGRWLAAHCCQYGFIIRYAEGKEPQTGYIYEPWHVRYLGDVRLATAITESGLSLEEFYGITSTY